MSTPPASKDFSTVRKWLDQSTQMLRDAHIESARLDAELILAHCFGVDRTWLLAHGDDTFKYKPIKANKLDNVEDSAFPVERSKTKQPLALSESDTLSNLFSKAIQKAYKLVEKRSQRIPLAYLIGHKEFYGRTFIVTPDVLIPRPESETLIELAKHYRVHGRILDVGCGSGALGLTLAAELPIHLTMSDVSPAALAVARRNARQLNIKPVGYIISDLLSHWVEHKKPTPFDTIVANLPYVDRNWERSPETDHEPDLALFASDHGRELIKKLLDQLPGMLRPQGYLFLEADPEQHASIIAYAPKSGLRLETTRDYILVFQKI